VDADPTLLADLKWLVDGDTRGDPERPLNVFQVFPTGPYRARNARDAAARLRLAPGNITYGAEVDTDGAPDGT